MYLKYYLKRMYFKILNITATGDSEWERQFDIKETELSAMSDQVLQLHEVMIRLIEVIRDEANRLRTCGTA